MTISGLHARRRPVESVVHESRGDGASVTDPAILLGRQPLVSILVVRRLIEMLEQKGVPRDLLDEALGHEAAPFEAADAHIPFRVVARICELAMGFTRDPALGLHWAQALNERTFGPLSYLLSNAGSLRRAFELVLQFERLFCDEPFCALIEDSDSMTVRMAAWPGASTPMVRFSAEVIMAGQLKMIRAICAHAEPRRVSFAYPAPLHFREYQRVFGEAVRFNEPFTELVLDRALLDAPTPHADADVHAALKTVAEQRLQRVTRPASYGSRLREILLKRVPEPTNMSIAARSLGLSVRSLRRHLTAEGTSYREIEYAALESVAKSLLRDKQRTIQETAYELGFSDATTFHRAFKRWTGMTPSEFRQRS